MKSKLLIHDITPAPDAWSRGYAYLEYCRIGLSIPFSTRIEVQ